jgi:hypothetical protein
MLDCLYLNLDHVMSASLLLSTTIAPAAAYNIQPTVTSVSATLVFSLIVNTTILDLTISEFILWTMNLRKYTNFIRLKKFKLT